MAKNVKGRRNEKIESKFAHQPINFKDEIDRSVYIPAKNVDKRILKTKKQKEIYDSIVNSSNTVHFITGPAGTAKTFISIASALRLLLEFKTDDYGGKDYIYDYIVMIRPAVESHENLGYLPGSLEEKMDPYWVVYTDTIAKILGTVPSELKKNDIKFESIAFIRGKTFEKSIVLVDESQNMNLEQFKLVLSRLGSNSKMVIFGDTKQTDIKKNQSALDMVSTSLADIKGVVHHVMNMQDQMRAPIINLMLEAIENKIEKNL